MLVSVSDLKAASLCVASPRDVREYLHNVFVDGENVVATNGHIAFIAKMDQSEPTFKTQIPKDILKGLFAYLGKSLATVSLTLKDGMVILSCGLYESQFEHDEYYVSYKPAFMNKTITFETTSIKVNLDYIGILQKISKIYRYKVDQPVLNFTGNNGMIFATFPKHNDITFFVMPMHI